MRLLHTADWHLGRIFYGHPLTQDQAHVLEGQLFSVIEDQAIDGLVIAGDIFDRPLPSLEAVQLWDRILTRLAAMKVPVFVIAGNHDSAARLAAGRAFYGAEGVHIWGTPDQCLEPYIWESPKGSLAICPMPYAEARTVYDALDLEEEAYKNDLNESYHAWADRLRQGIPDGMPSLAICHAFVAGAISAGSERPLSVGGTDYVQPKAFAGFTYIALGHIHNGQQAGVESIRYSGSPLKYSFDECHHKKAFTIVDIDEKGHLSLSYIPVETKRDLVIIEGALEDLLNDQNRRRDHEGDYVLARLTDALPPQDGMARLRKAYPYALALEMLDLDQGPEEEITIGAYRHLEPRQLFAQFAKAVWDRDLEPDESAYMDTLWADLEKEDQV